MAAIECMYDTTKHGIVEVWSVLLRCSMCANDYRGLVAYDAMTVQIPRPVKTPRAYMISDHIVST